MATLRDPFFAPNTVSIDEMQQLQDADKGSLRRGWEAGRIGSERNALGIDEVAARAAGDIQRAETLRMQNDALGQAQARVAPEVQRVEDINWEPGKALNWFSGAVGQGLASMAEPVAAATALGGIGRVAGMLPGAAGKVGRAIGTVGAPAAAFGINQRQMAGEFANNAMQDPELMARTSPQGLHQTANLYGAGAGLLDTALPGVIGHQLTGGALRAGMKAAGAGMGPAAKTGLGMLGEGTTEYLQGKGSQLVQGMLNPNRDTSGDASDDLNNFAGGMAGGGPLIAAGAYADAGYRRVGQAADMVGTKTGEMVDLAKEKYDGSALQGGVDKAMAAGKQKAGDMVDLLDQVRSDDGKVSLTKMADLVEGARDSANELVQRYKVSNEERDLLNLTPPAGIAEDQAEHDAWLAQADDQRLQFVGGRLNDMVEADPRAADILERMAAAQSRDEQVTIADEGAKLILETNEIEQLASRGERAAAAMGEMASKGASALGKGAVAVGKGAMKFGKAVFDGAAAEARKKNAQGEDYAAKGYEAWQERTGRAATDRVVQGAKNSPAAAQAKRRGDLFGEMLATETRAAMAKRGYAGKRADNIVALMQDVGYDVAHLSSKGGPQGTNAALTIARTADTLRTALGPRAESAVDELRALADPKAAKMFDQLRVAVETSRTPYGQKQLQQMRTAAANQLMAILPTEDMQELLQSEAAGGKLTRNWLLETVEGLANGQESPELREALTEKFGETALSEMLAVVANDLPAPTTVYGKGADYESLVEATVNEDGEYEAETTETSDFDKRQNEKKVAKGSGPKVYGFAKTAGQSLRGSTDRRDPFAPLTRTGKGATPDRPLLFKLTDTLFEGGNALEKKIADMEAQLEKVGGHYVGKQSAYDVMKDLGFQPAKALSVYRDYLMQDAAAKGLDPAAKSALLDKAARVSAMVLDKMAQRDGQRGGFRPVAGEREQLMADAKAYFQEHYVAVAEKLSGAVPNRIEVTELLNMGRAGAAVLSVAKLEGAKAAKKALESGSTKAQAEGVGKDAEHAVLDDANLITFQSDLLKNKDRGLHIKADTLVKWVQAQRNRNEAKDDAKDDYSNRSKNQAYLTDLLEGIAAVVDSGMVDTNKVYNPKTKKHEARMAATRINAEGEYEAFITDPKTEERTRKDGSTVDVPVYPKNSPNGIPPSLRLVTSTYGAMMKGKEERTKARPKAEGPPKPESDPTSDQYQGAVDRDQAKNEEFFVMDPWSEDEREADAWYGGKSDGEKVTPSDFPRAQEEAERKDLAFRTTEKAADVAVGPENKMSAMVKAPERGAEIARTLNKDFAAGVAMIESRLRSAQRPEFIADKKARETSAVGGQHYVMPLAYALNLDTISKLDLGPAEAKKLTALRGEAAKIILLADKLKENQKVALTKAMAPAASADKVNLANYAKLLQKASEPATPAPAPAPAPASGTGLLAKTLKARLEYLNNPPADYTAAKAREIDAWAKRQLERINEAIKGVDEMSEQYDALDEARFTAKQLVKKAASVLEGDEHLIKEGFADAPEVASVERPKSQPKPSGGRDLGALAGRTAPAEFTNHSGGALGADSMFDKVGRSLGFTKHNHYYHGNKTPTGNVALTQSQVDEGIVHAKRAAAALARPWNDKYASLLGRNWFQVKNASQIIAVAPLIEPGERNGKGYASRAKRTTVDGGTGYAVEMAIANGKEVHVFDTKSNQWFAWDGQGFVESGVPALAKDYAGIGSRQDYGRMTPESIQAIRDVFEKALASKTDLWSDTGARKLSAMSSEIHNDLQRGGFAATHDSPIRHEGKFNWREHTGTGGGSAFGVGTYLSTGDKVHNYYKKMMTEKAGTRSPTYHVSVNVMKAQLLNWDKPLSEQSSYVQKRLEENALLGAPDLKGADLYQGLTARLGSQAAASDYLQNLGILGHEYAASNGRNGKTPNYVIYDDSKITTNYVHFNKQGGNSRVASQAEMDEAKAYVRKVLGPQIKVEFKDITGYAGEWLDAEQAIEISTTAAPGVLHTAYHEALHGFFSKFVKNDPRALDVLRSLAENDKILARVAALLAGHPAAIDQLKSGEERLAYIYQFWAAGKLDLPMGKPRTMLQKVRKFFRRVLGLVKDSERAVALFEAFHGGQLAEPSAAGKVIARVLDEGTGVLKARRSMDGLTQWLAAKTMPAETVLATSESKAAQALAKEFFTNPGDEDAGKEAEGYLNARTRIARRYNNTFMQDVAGLSDRDLTEVAKLLQDEAELADIPYAPHREAVGKIRGLLQRFYKYMSDERGLELGHAGEKYFPRVWNTHLLHEKKDQFVQMLATHYDAVLEQGAQGSKGKLSKEQVAERIWRALVDREGVNDKLDAQRQDGVLAPFFASKENRTLAWLSGEHAQPFLEKNLVATLSRYFHQGVRAAEYTDRFGADGAELEAKLMEIQGELTELSMVKLQRKEFKDDAARAKWVSRQYRDVAEAVGAMEGTLGKDVSPTVRKLNSWVTVYQNVRLLPLSLFASFVDPLGMVARGATMKEAYDAFLRGMKEVTSNWGDMFREEPKERQADQWEKLAEHVGAVDAALFAHHVSDEYSSVYMERGAKTINDTMFKLNGMEAWNRGMRVAGVKSAVAFIERHAGGADKIHSTRWLEELGLDPKNIPLDTEGKLITDKSVLMQQKGMGKSQAEREIDAVHYAINRWVEGAILTPNAAQRPAWGSDPHYSMFFHLKQFSYSFHQTILKRAVKEMNHGNLAPMGAFVWYIPTMIAADITKGLIQGGGELPAYMKGYDAGDWMMHGVQRAGLLGAGQIGVDAGEDMFSLAGPGVEQMIDAMRDPLSETTIKALPAHGIYAQALR